MTTRCNLNCAHCYAAKWMLDHEGATDLSYNDFADSLQKVAKAGIRYIHFLGGEPTVRRDFIDLIRVARSNGIDVSFNTNGQIHDDKIIDAIFNLKIASVTVSIDGVDATSNDAIRGKGTYNRAIKFVEKIADKKEELGTNRPEIQIQMVVTPLWHKRINLAFELASSLRANALVISFIELKGSARVNASWLSLSYEEAFEAAGEILLGSMRHPELNVHSPIKAKVVEYYRELTGFSLPVSPFECKALTTRVNIFSDGTIAPCEVAHEQGMAEGLLVPNIVQANIKDGWSFSYFDRFASQAFDDPENTYANYEPCNRCIFLFRICTPCPLIGGRKPIMPLCLIADALLTKGRELGGVSKVSDVIRADTLRAVLGEIERARRT